MANRPSLEQLLHKLYAARINGSLDQLCSLFVPDVRFRIAGTSDGKPIAIIAQGIDAVRPWLSMLVKTFRLSDHRTISTLVDGDRAAVHWSATIHSRITGSIVPTELVDMVDARHSYIISYTEFFLPMMSTAVVDRDK